MSDITHIQFCADDQDISSEPYRELDATEVRVWSEEGVVVAVSSGADGKWHYESSDFGPNPEWDTDGTFDSWEEALRAFGY
ncbi:hypothetical protein MUG78_17720 [Gordonia alkaliphila]|uniref:hypothetical protein n=1 Tax=Gordonia alkaliphila TaxID=1053547 RepID=UPI001FF5A7F3|nr:hypothetical protein [Gordonia alkaliphila]MCK0441240.1 hypothetical protein [Gordonia alkaliphila]